VVVSLNEPAFDHAKRLIRARRAVADDRDDWSEHRPSAGDEDRYLEQHGFEEYAKWHLGIDDDAGERTKGRYAFPYGDFERVHRCGVVAAELRAARNDYFDIEVAAAHLHGMLDMLRES
jgi:hypothetical protein